jgi:hypothetical protein
VCEQITTADGRDVDTPGRPSIALKERSANSGITACRKVVP